MGHWRLWSPDSVITLDVDAGDGGAMSGRLSVGPTIFPVTGSWAASGSVPGRNASAFSLVGGAGNPSTFVSAAGIMVGPGASPQRVTMKVYVSSSGDGSITSYDAVLTPQAPTRSPWLLGFTSDDPGSAAGDGRPWGDGTGMARRAGAGVVPWDEGNSVLPMIGGDETMSAIREVFERAIAEATTGSVSTRPPGQRGHVYIADWQFNALRDLASNTSPWTAANPGSKAQTALGLVCRMMAAGITVRLMLWMPTTAQAVPKFGAVSLAAEHWAVAAAVQDYNNTLLKRFGMNQPLGVVALDLRTAAPLTASLHQKMIAVRVGAVDVAFCGGVDLAFTRRDHGLAGTKSIGVGDWQSGTTSPAPTWWSSMSGTDYPPFPDPSAKAPAAFGEDLPANVYGPTAPGWRHWHDHHLRLVGPVVATLEQQFAERWVIDTNGNATLFNRNAWYIGGDNQVQLTSPQAIAGGRVVPLPDPRPVPAAGTSRVQMWRTIPLRPDVRVGPFVRGEFTVTAGVANAITASTQLITVWDQYFWSEPVARQLAAQVRAQPNLRLLVVLPPYGSTSPSNELWYRRRAIQTLAAGLDPASRARVTVMNMWDRATNTGVYVHAKCQTYDENLLVCGSANLNRRSTECDAELDCAVADGDVVRTHLANLHACLVGRPWTNFAPGWLAAYWGALTTQTANTLIPDPFWVNSPNPQTPNGVSMKPGGMIPESQFEPTSIAPATFWAPGMPQPVSLPLESSTCTFPGCAGDPKAAGRLDEVSFLLERCHEKPTSPINREWPWRQPASS